MKRRSFGLIAGAVVILSGFGYLVYGGIGDNIVYFLTPGELHARGERAVDAPVRLGGQVKPGSVRWDAQQLDLRFVLQDADGEVEVHSTKAPPQMFREEMGVVVEGRLRRGGVFEATNLMVMHSNEYRAPEEGSHPRDLYRSLIPDEGGR
jgi:cytochrome c-type biogenesis protein CcmE